MHITAISWLLTSVFIATHLHLLVSGQWGACVLFTLGLFVAGSFSVQTRPAVSRFLLNGPSFAVGGVRVIRPSKSSAAHPDRLARNLLAIHPHGISSTATGMALIDCARRDERTALAVAPILRWWNPIMRLIMNLSGIDVISASPSGISECMQAGKSLAIVVGGFHELLLNDDSSDVVFLKSRKGFVKYAIRHGYDITPVYCFGESQLYSNKLRLGDRVRNFLAEWKLPVVLPLGSSCCNLMPRKLSKGVVIAFGSPLSVTKNLHPSREQIDSVHAIYMHKLAELYTQHNPYLHRPLVIV